MEYDQIADPRFVEHGIRAQDKGLLGATVYYRAAWTPKGLVHPRCAGEWASFERYAGDPGQKCAKCGKRLEVAK